ncbi:MAG: oxidoreductase [Robiginitomaculum sp.]|nr:oxidoreductase [Robiginitomaculum sp.]
MYDNGTLIIGGGNAGFQVADSLRKGGYAHSITILCAENTLPYQRPPLSKKFLAGEMDKERLHLRPEKYFSMQDIVLHKNCEVVQVNNKSRYVKCVDGRKVAYDKLVFATGARVRKLPITARGLLYLRTYDDVFAITKILETAENIALIGGGFIGLEVAATLRGLGKCVTIIEAMPTIMPNVVGESLAQYFTNYHRKNGVKIMTNLLVENIENTNNGAYKLQLNQGQTLDVDAVIIGIGVLPNTELASDMGVLTDHGIIVDEFGQTNIDDVYAAGDCAHGMNMWVGEPVHLESVQNAVDQSKIVASTILGNKTAYNIVPWFWSDQYGLKLQMAGLSRGHDQFSLRGDMDIDKFSICYFKDEQLIAVDSVNAPADHLAARRLLAGRVRITPKDCSNTDIPLKSFL